LKRFGAAEKKMKTRTVNGAFWRYLKRLGTFMSRLVGAHPLVLRFYCICVYFIFWLSSYASAVHSYIKNL